MIGRKLIVVIAAIVALAGGVLLGLYGLGSQSMFQNRTAHPARQSCGGDDEQVSFLRSSIVLGGLWRPPA